MTRRIIACQSCRRGILLAPRWDPDEVPSRTGLARAMKPVPLDPEPSGDPRAVWAVSGVSSPRCRPLAKGEAPNSDEQLHVAHRDTCAPGKPKAARHEQRALQLVAEPAAVVLGFDGPTVTPHHGTDSRHSVWTGWFGGWSVRLSAIDHARADR